MDPEQVNAFCAALGTAWDSSTVSQSLDSCEGRTVAQGAMFHTNDTGEHIINSLWHGIPDGANADRVWMPEGHSEGRTAVAADEIVIDAHVTEALELQSRRYGEHWSGKCNGRIHARGHGVPPTARAHGARRGRCSPPEPGRIRGGLPLRCGNGSI